MGCSSRYTGFWFSQNLLEILNWKWEKFTFEKDVARNHSRNPPGTGNEYINSDISPTRFLKCLGKDSWIPEMPRKLTCSLKRSHFKIVKDRLPSHYCFKPTCQKLRFNLRIQYPRFFQKEKTWPTSTLGRKKRWKKHQLTRSGWAPGRFGPSTSVDNAGAWRSATSCPSSLFYRRFSEKTEGVFSRILGFWDVDVLGLWVSFNWITQTKQLKLCVN